VVTKREPLQDLPDNLLPAATVQRLREQLPDVAALGIAAITDEVPEYADLLAGPSGSIFSSAIRLSLGAFLRLLDRGPAALGDESPLAAARQGAYELGRGEAKSGRTADALLAAYRIGARVSWRSMAATAVEQDVAADVVARFAELMFDYIDDLSASSVAGHTDQLARSGRLREQRREQLAQALLSDAPADRLIELAANASWPAPDSLTAVLLPASRVRDTLPQLSNDTLHVPTDLLELEASVPMSVLLVPDMVRTRAHLVDVLRGRGAAVGPARPWLQARASVELAARLRRVIGSTPDGVLDAADHLDALVVGADPGAVHDLRAAVLAPLADLAPAAAARLTETLRAWLTHLGRRGDVAEALQIHPQTVRYRMTQLRELYGDRLEDPGTVQALVIALRLPPTESG
jgi:hypothetical protein